MTADRLFDLTGKVVVITGATGILGRHYVAAIAEAGALVAVCDMQQTTCDELAANHPGSQGFGVDVSDNNDVMRVVTAIEAALGPIDVLLNNAATKGRDLAAFFASIEDFDPQTWRDVMAVNLDGAFFVARAVGLRMAERRRGSIINISSIYGNVGPDQRIYEGSHYLGQQINTPAVYSASKAGIIGMTRHLATLWGGAGIRVNTLTPGGVASGQNDVFDRAYSSRVPLGRMAEPADMIGPAIFLASDASRYVTGHNLVVDGGWTIW